MRVLDLFSGIGGFSLGLGRAGMTTVAFCEIDPYCRRVLAKHWPEVPCYDDIRTLTADRLAADGVAVDAICGGFPCQDLSIAGAAHGGRAGLDGERSGLWGEIARLVREIRPRLVLVENTPALLDGRWFGRVLGDLAALGYDVEWECIPAAFVGAPIIRDRVWIAAVPHGDRLAGRLLCATTLRRSTALVGADVWASLPAHRGHNSRNGIPHFVDETRALGNAVVPQIPELIGRAILASEAEALAA